MRHELPPSRLATRADLPRKGGGAPSMPLVHTLASGSNSSLLHLLDVHPDLAAAGEADLPGGLVGDAEFEGARLAALDHVDRLGDHRALDTAARDRAQEIALVVDHQVGADRPRRR